MKLLQFAFIFSMLSVLIACGGNSSVKDAARDSLDVPESSTTTTGDISTTDAQTITPSNTASTGSVPHYICPNNCEGGGGPSAGSCPVCGTAFTHNQAFHSQQQNTSPITIDGDNGGVQVTPTTNPTASPSTNAAGVYHYTCPNGCDGGAAGAGSCAGCGTALVHNTAYHNN